MSDKNRPACIFCNLNTSPTSDEHVLPHHWKKTFPAATEGQVQVGRNRDGSDRDPVEKKQVTPYDLKVKRVCESCNNGWMREMDEAAKDLIFDLSWGENECVTGDQAEQLATWCTKVALVRTHRERGREQDSPLELTHRFYAERTTLGPKTVQIARVANSEAALSGNIVRELRSPVMSSDGLGHKLDSAHLVTFQIGQLFFQVGLATSSDWASREMKTLLAAGRRNRTDRVHVLHAGQEVPLANGLTQSEVMDVIATCRRVSQVSAHRETQSLREAFRTAGDIGALR